MDMRMRLEIGDAVFVIVTMLIITGVSYHVTAEGREALQGLSTRMLKSY